MKKIVKIVIIIAVVFALMMSISSNSSRQVFLSKAKNIDVVIEHDKLSKEKLNDIIGIISEKDSQDPMISIASFNLFCLFGHSLETAHGIVTEHNASYDAPRCFRRYVSATFCTRNGCNYGTVTENGSGYFYCH